jgi:DNA-binding PadR family transcriptional regulator
MRNEHGFRFAVLGEISRSPNGTYGWALKKECDKRLGNFWQINLGEVYRVLDDLAQNSEIELVDGPGSPRKLYRITEKGRRNLDDFILSPPTDAPRPLRQELAVKLLFASPQHLPELLTFIDQQREAYMQQVGKLEIQRRILRRSKVDCWVTMQLINGAELSARAELAWLDDVTEELKRRFTDGA